MNTEFEVFLKEQLVDFEIRKEYEAMQSERAVMQAIIDARLNSGLTQKELAERTDIEDEYDLAIFEEALAEYKTGSCKSRPEEEFSAEPKFVQKRRESRTLKKVSTLENENV